MYNEERFVEAILRKVAASPIDTEIIVVDDGSTDATAQILARLQRELPIQVITQPKNLGKGAAVRVGFQVATGEILLIQDADLEYDPGDYPVLLGPILRDEADAVIGSRFVMQKSRLINPHGEIFFLHYIGNKLVIWLTNLLYGFQATDYEACYKAVRSVAIQDIPLTANGFDFDNELICKLLRLRRRIVEAPIHYYPRAYKEGKKIQWQHGVQMLWAIVKWRVVPLHSCGAPAPSAGELAPSRQNPLRDARREPRALRKQQRSFGLSVGVVCMLLAIHFLRHDQLMPAWACGLLSPALIVCGLAAPELLQGPSALWWQALQGIGWVNMRIFLTVVFFAVLTPVGLVRRLRGWDPLMLKRGVNGSWWVPYPQRYLDSKHYDRMF